jgi:hypothetical protein
MATKKSPATKLNPDNPGNPVQVLKEATCFTSNGKSILGYQVGKDDSGEIFMQLTSNSGGGFFTSEWISYTAIQKALKAWPADQPITSMALRTLSRGKSANNAGFLCAVLVAEGLLEPVPGKTRVHQLADPSAFLASVSGGTSKKPVAKSKAKTKASPKAKAKAAPKAKTPRKAR